MKRKGCLIVVSGPSGTGKGTVCSALLEKYKEIAYSISATTRQPRTGEVDGVNYYFLAKNVFEKMIEDGELLEWAEVYGNYYGTPLKKIQERLADGQDILLEIDTQGAMSVKEKFPDEIYIYIMPPSLKELERRLKTRGTDSAESIERRLKSAAGEMEIAERYNYIVVNEQVEQAVEQIAAIVDAEHCRVGRNKEIIDNIKEGK